jgi:hypothetical protein
MPRSRETEIELSSVDVERKYDDEIAESSAHLLSEADPRAEEAIVLLGAEQAQLDANYISPDVDAAQRAPIQDALGGVRDRAAGHDEFARRLEAIEHVLELNNQGNADEAERRRKDNVRKFLLLFGLVSISLTVATLILTAVHRCASGRGMDDLPLSDDVKARIRELVTAWKGLSDRYFWRQMANYADVNGATVADLIFFMQYTKLLSPLDRPFLWGSYQDQLNFVQRLRDMYARSGIKGLFESLPELEYTQPGKPSPEPIPRFYCADLAQMALSEIAMASPSRQRSQGGSRGKLGVMADPPNDDDHDQEEISGPEFHVDPEELAEAAREVIAAGDAELEADYRNLSLRLDELEVNLASPVLDQVQAQRYTDPNSGVRGRDGTDAVAKKEQAVQAVLDKNSSGDAVEERKKKESNAAKYCFLFGLIVTGATIGIVMTALNRAAHGQNADDLPLPDNVKAQIEALVKAWQQLPEETYWAQLADYAGRSEATIADMIYFMQYTMVLSPLQAPWLWNSYADKDDYSGKLVAASKVGGLPALFNQVPLLRYQREGRPAPEPLPRYIGANLVQLALGGLTL